MAIFRVNRHNGCIIRYNENPIELATGEQVDYEVEGVYRPNGVSDEDWDDFLKAFENRINTEVAARRGLQGVFPHFYIRCPFADIMDRLVTLFNMSYVDDHRIMLCPPDDRLVFHGNWDEYLQMKKESGENILIMNATDTEDEGSMIQFWIDKTAFEFGYSSYLCPATNDLLNRDGLDGAHVEIVGHPEMGRFIIPVKKEFNRSHSRRSFYVKPEYLVVAPREEEEKEEQ